MADDGDNGFSEWGGYFEAKKTKLEEQFAAASDPFRQSDLFQGISIFVNGRTDPSADELKRIMMVHGGIFHHYERPHTTYIIATNLPDVKVRNMNTSKIISPQWVVDCLKEKRIKDYTCYLLYTNQRSTQPRIQFGKSSSNQSKLINIESENQEPNITASQIESEQNVSVKQKPLIGAELNISAPHILKTTARTAVDPKFLQEFYNNSRLHHIATLGADCKEYVCEMRSKHLMDDGFPARTKIKDVILIAQNGLTSAPTVTTATDSSCVMHIDMDCFFVSVGLRNHPELRGMPVAVTHSKGGNAATEVPVHPQADRQAEMELFAKRFEEHLHDNIRSDKVRNGFEAKMSLSEIASCSYEAREKGLRNGMFVGEALKLCPNLKTLPYDFEAYREVAFTLYDTVAQYTLNIEAVSCDEMFVDLSDVLRDLKVSAMDFVSALREEVRRKTGCPCSAGIGANKLQARMATKQAKPDGQFKLQSENVVAYMAPISIKELPGVGSSTTHTLKMAKLLTCGDLQKVSLAKIQMHLGKKLGETVYQYCRGNDNRPLVYDKIRKSISSEVNYGIRFKSSDECDTFMQQLSAEVHKRLLDKNRKAKCITLKLMVRAQEAPVEASKFMGHGVCDNYTKSESLKDYTDDLKKISETVFALLKSLNVPPQEMRGIGITLSKLDEPQQNSNVGKKENTIMNMFSKVAEKQKKESIVKDNSLIKEQSAKDECKISPPLKSTADKKVVSKDSFKSGTSKRGRPSKNSVVANQSVVKKPSNVLNMLQNASTISKKPITVDINKNSLPDDIDLNVLAELPEDIRNEIVMSHAHLSKVNQQQPTRRQSTMIELNKSDLQPSTSKKALITMAPKKSIAVLEENNAAVSSERKVDPAFMDALPPDVRLEIQQQLQEQVTALSPKKHTTIVNRARVVDHQVHRSVPPKVNDDNLFFDKNFLKVMRSWVEMTPEPNDADIDVLSKSVNNLVELEELDKLYEGMLYLCRLINTYRNTKEYCQWHRSYKMVVETLQMQMRLLNDGKTLKLGADLNCKDCKM